MVLPFLYFLTKPEVKVVYDVGAAVGIFAVALAKQTNIHQVVAFEPLPDSWVELKKRTENNPKIKCYNTAVGEQSTSMRFFVTEDGNSSSCLPPTRFQATAFPTRGLARETNVKVVSLDNIQKEMRLPMPDVLIVDAQGFELQVLRGAENCLKLTRYCILECSYVALYEGAPLINEILAYMHRIGWRVIGAGPQLHDGTSRPIVIDLVFGQY